MNDWNISNGDLIEDFIAQAGLSTQQDMAAALGWSPARLSNARRSTRLNGDLLVAILNRQPGSGIIQGAGLCTAKEIAARYAGKKIK